MKPDLSLLETEELLRLRNDENLSYDILQCLLKRWSNGIDVKYLVDLLESDHSSTQAYGISCLFDVDYPDDTDLNAAVEKLGGDPLGWARRAFISFVRNTLIYNDGIAHSLAACVSDYDLLVRNMALGWAVTATDERFDHVTRLVEAGTTATTFKRWQSSELKRGLRTLSIARRLRDGEPILKIRETVPQEDDFILDRLESFETQRQRYCKRRMALN